MRIDVEVLVRTRGGRSRKVIHRIERDLEGRAEEGIGLGLGDMKAIVAGLQRVVVDEQARELIQSRSGCASCGRILGHKGASRIVYRTPFGKFELASPRLYSKCPCGHRASGSISFNPLGMAIPSRSHPDLIYLQSRWASHVSYNRSVSLLADVLPLDAVPAASSVKGHVRRLGGGMARDTYEQAEQFFDSQPLQFPDPPDEPAKQALEIDAGYIRGIPERCAGRRTFAIITARLKKSQTPAAYDAFVNEITRAPLARFHHFLHRAGVDIDEPVAIIGDGGEDVAYPSYLPWRPVTRILDWFHIAMRFEHLLQRARGLHKEAPERSERLVKQLESAKWRLWHGQSDRSINRLREVQEDTAEIFHQRVSEMIRYLELNRDRLICYCSRYRSQLAISTSLAESAVNSVIGERFKKQRQMRWTLEGANSLLHLRVADLNGVLRDYVGAHLKRHTAANDSSFAAAA